MGGGSSVCVCTPEPEAVRTCRPALTLCARLDYNYLVGRPEGDCTGKKVSALSLLFGAWPGSVRRGHEALTYNMLAPRSSFLLLLKRMTAVVKERNIPPIKKTL